MGRFDKTWLTSAYQRDPRVFDIYGYCLTFGFCTCEEKARLYACLLSAWRWGREAARANLAARPDNPLGTKGKITRL